MIKTTIARTTLPRSREYLIDPPNNALNICEVLFMILSFLFKSGLRWLVNSDHCVLLRKIATNTLALAGRSEL